MIDETILDVVKAPAEPQMAPYTYIPPSVHSGGTSTATGGNISTDTTTNPITVHWQGMWVTDTDGTYYIDKNLNKIKK